MVERRTLGKALDISPEKLSFIQDGGVARERSSGIQTRSEPVHRGEAELKSVSPGMGESPRAPSEFSQNSAAMTVPGLSRILVPLTTRLNPATLQALRRACLEQRLQYRTPDSVQQIVEEAIRDWLRDRGFLG